MSILNRYDCSKTDACDVINYEEYEDVTNKILEKKPTRAITISVDMKDIERSIKVCTLQIHYLCYLLTLLFRKMG